MNNPQQTLRDLATDFLCDSYNHYVSSTCLKFKYLCFICFILTSFLYDFVQMLRALISSVENANMIRTILKSFFFKNCYFCFFLLFFTNLSLNDSIYDNILEGDKYKLHLKQ